VPEPTILHDDGTEITLRVGDRIVRGAVERRGGRLLVHWRGLVWQVESAVAPARRAGTVGPAASDLFAPMTGTVVQVFAKDGQAVEAGAPLVIVEAMKMEHRIVAPAKAVVARVHVKSGDQVDFGTQLVSLKLDGAS
jgi:3-methylcrotonyl-CoA carboxylase alpha subunit